jgi:hypothetical protein
MTKRIPLDALLRRVSRMAEHVFDKHGDIDPIWLVENASGEQHGIVSPVVSPSPLAAAAEKDRIADKLREHFAENDIVRYARAVESWTVAFGAEEQIDLRYAAMGYTLANHPDRREVILIEANDGSEFLTAFRDIIRPAHGRPNLGKLGAIERLNHIEGRWLNLLPSKEHDAALRERPQPPPRRVRSSNELPDDVDTVFVTAVPNAPLQILGRRDPATGELCVGSVMKPPTDAPWPPFERPSCVEIVTGPEAERLILAVHGDLTEQAEQEGLTLEQFIAKTSKGPKP